MLANRTPEDVQHKYSNSLLYYKGRPVFCIQGGPKDRGHGFGIHYQALGPNFGINNEWADVEDPDWAEGPFKLGYINGVKYMNLEDGMPVEGTSFVARAPIRKFKQGLTKENLVFQDGRTSFNNMLAHQPFVDMLTGKYPSFAAAWKQLNAKRVKVAYHRHWALGINKLDILEVGYRGHLVGMGETPDTIKLGPKFQYLNEAFAASRE